MLQKLLAHSADLAQLQQEGFELEVRGGYLLAHHVPYVTADKEVKYGTLVSELTLLNQHTTTRPSTHTVQWTGEPPCDVNGNRLEGIYNSPAHSKLLPSLEVYHLFSNKPQNGYVDYYQKISTYVNIIQSQARALQPKVTALTFRVHPDEESEIFQYVNTNSTRAKTTTLDHKFARQRVAIIGMGGTGAYLLDSLAKCPIPEIHLYDGDLFHQHNAFRSPGAASSELLDQVLYKVDYYAQMYGNMHKRIIPHAGYITPENLSELLPMTQIFIAIDKPEAKRFIYPLLMREQKSFIDVGMGLHIRNEQIIGTMRVTMGMNGVYDHFAQRVPMSEEDDNDYNANIQVAELNALNANLAVIAWKKTLGYYGDQMHEKNLCYNIDTSQLVDDDHTI